MRHKVFISYHHADQDEVEEFVDTFDHERDVFITRALGVEMEQDIIDSDDPDYVMRADKGIVFERFYCYHCFNRKVYLGAPLCRLGNSSVVKTW